MLAKKISFTSLCQECTESHCALIVFNIFETVRSWPEWRINFETKNLKLEIQRVQRNSNNKQNSMQYYVCGSMTWSPEPCTQKEPFINWLNWNAAFVAATVAVCDSLAIPQTRGKNCITKLENQINKMTTVLCNNIYIRLVLRRSVTFHNS